MKQNCNVFRPDRLPRREIKEDTQRAEKRDRNSSAPQHASPPAPRFDRVNKSLIFKLPMDRLRGFLPSSIPAGLEPPVVHEQNIDIPVRRRLRDRRLRLHGIGLIGGDRNVFVSLRRLFAGRFQGAAVSIKFREKTEHQLVDITWPAYSVRGFRLSTRVVGFRRG